MPKLICLAEYCPHNFLAVELMALDDQLETYIIDMHSSKEFHEMQVLVH